MVTLWVAWRGSSFKYVSNSEQVSETSTQTESSLIELDQLHGLEDCQILQLRLLMW